MNEWLFLLLQFISQNSSRNQLSLMGMREWLLKPMAEIKIDTGKTWIWFLVQHACKKNGRGWQLAERLAVSNPLSSYNFLGLGYLFHDSWKRNWGIQVTSELNTQAYLNHFLRRWAMISGIVLTLIYVSMWWSAIRTMNTRQDFSFSKQNTRTGTNITRNRQTSFVLLI